jgi:Transglycosylase SLT domain
LNKEIDLAIIENAEKFRIDANLMRAIIAVESAYQPFANRFEVNTEKYCVTPASYASRLRITELTERHNQMTSWGLCQMMGFNLRAMGYLDHIPAACIPSINLYYMCKLLKTLFQKYGDESDVISSYNQGSPRKTAGKMYENQRYVDKVFAELMKFRGLDH